MILILVILLVLKLEIINSFNDEHLENIAFILVILLVLKLERFIYLMMNIHRTFHSYKLHYLYLN